MKTVPTEADCWFVIGAHQAGATEARCAELAGLTRQATHKIIANFKHLGSPHASSVPSASVFMNPEFLKRKKAGVDDAPPRKRGRPRTQVVHAEAKRVIQHTVLHTEEEQNIDGWAEEDDRLLLMHVLKMQQNFNWKEAEGLFETKHFAKMCHERWEFLRKELVTNLKKR